MTISSAHREARILGLFVAVFVFGTIAIAQGAERYGAKCALKAPAGQDWKGKYCIIWTPDRRFTPGDPCRCEIIVQFAPRKTEVKEGRVEWIKREGEISEAERNAAVPATGKVLPPEDCPLGIPHQCNDEEN